MHTHTHARTQTRGHEISRATTNKSRTGFDQRSVIPASISSPSKSAYLRVERIAIEFHLLEEEALDAPFLYDVRRPGQVVVELIPDRLLWFAEAVLHVDRRIPVLVPVFQLSLLALSSG